MRRLVPLVAILLAASCANRAAAPSRPTASPAAPTSQPSEAPAAVETNPAGDIPDSTQFVTYRSANGHYSLQHPEGWAQSNSGAGVVFADKEHSIGVAIESASSPRTP